MALFGSGTFGSFVFGQAPLQQQTAPDKLSFTRVFGEALGGFGLAIYESPEATIANHISVSADNIAFWQSQIARFLSQRGDTKPATVNRDLLPYTYYENTDVFNPSPIVIMDRNFVDIFAIFAMMKLAANYRLQVGDPTWFMTLLNFLVKVTL